MLFQNHKIIMTACTSLAIVGFSLGGANASETKLNTDTINFQGQEYRYPPAEDFKPAVQKPAPVVSPQVKPVTRAPLRAQAPQPIRRPVNVNPGFNNRYPVRPYPVRPPVNRPVYGRPGMVPPPYARTGAVPPPPPRPGFTPPPPRPAGAPPMNPPFAGPGGRSAPGNSAVVIRDPDIPKEYANNPYINGTYNNNPPPPPGGPNYGRRSGGSGPFKNMGFGPFNGNDAPWETWPFGGRDSFWSRKEFPFKQQNPSDWFNPGDPKEGLAIMWDDLIAAPDDLGTMPGGWTVPSVRVPNPVDLEDQLEKASKEVPDLIRVYE